MPDIEKLFSQHGLEKQIELLEKKLEEGSYPYIEQKQIVPGYKFILIQPEQYLLIDETSFGYNVHKCHEILKAESGYTFVPEHKSLYGIAKSPKRDDTPIEYILYSQQAVQQAGIAPAVSDKLISKSKYIFMKNIDNGYTLEKAMKDNKNPKEIILCCFKAMQDALKLREEKGIVHIDIQAPNIMFPSGTCIDLELCAMLDAKRDSVYGMLPKLQILENISLKDFSSDQNIPIDMIQNKKHGRDGIYISKYATDYEFSYLFSVIITYCKSKSVDENIISLLQKCQEKLQNRSYKLEDAIILMKQTVDLIEQEDRDEKFSNSLLLIMSKLDISEEKSAEICVENPIEEEKKENNDESHVILEEDDLDNINLQKILKEDDEEDIKEDDLEQSGELRGAQESLLSILREDDENNENDINKLIKKRK